MIGRSLVYESPIVDDDTPDDEEGSWAACGRRAYALMSVARSTLRYQSRQVERDAPVVAVMRQLAAQYPRYGYRRIQVFLARRGHVMSADRVHRLWPSSLGQLTPAEFKRTLPTMSPEPPIS